MLWQAGRAGVMGGGRSFVFPQVIHPSLTYSVVSNGTLEASLPFVVPPSDDRTIIIASSMQDTNGLRVTAVNWGVEFSLVVERWDFQISSRIWAARVPAMQGSSADLVIAVSNSPMDELALTILGVDGVDSISAVDTGARRDGGTGYTLSNIATTADGFAVGVGTLLSGSATVTDFFGNGPTGALEEVDQVIKSPLSHNVWLGPTPATGTTEDFTVLFSASQFSSAMTIATFK